jgi:hypothetical protein
MSETKLPDLPVYDLPTLIKDFPPLVEPVPNMPESPDKPQAPIKMPDEPKPAHK